MTKLFNLDTNAKTVKGRSVGYATAILYLAASDASGVQLCPMSALARCDAPCLLTAGRGGMAKGNATFISPGGRELPDNTVQRARLRRTELFLTDPDAFFAQLCRELEKFIATLPDDLVPCVRMNGTSDIRWEDLTVPHRGTVYENIFAAFPDVQFYDYTKIPNRRRALNIPNYHLTFSYSGVSDFAPVVLQAMRTYGSKVNYAVVFRGTPPEYFLGRRVVNGDESDLRFLDERGVVVALKAKGRAKKDTSGFVIAA